MGAAAKVRRGDIRHAIVVRTAKKVQRKDGMVVKFDDNACALIGKNGEPIGTRVNGKPLFFLIGILVYRMPQLPTLRSMIAFADTFW